MKIKTLDNTNTARKSGQKQFNVYLMPDLITARLILGAATQVAW
jgi:hypothetical protein